MNTAPLLIEPVYKDHIHAIRCALSVSAGAMGYIAARWQQDYQAGYRVHSVGSDMTRAERFTQDCMTRQLLHHHLSCEHWAVLVVRFAPPLNTRGTLDESEVEEMRRALKTLLELLEHPITPEFTRWCLLRWAQRMPAGRGKWAEWEGRTSVSMPTLHRRCADSVYKPMLFREQSALESAKEKLLRFGLISSILPVDER